LFTVKTPSEQVVITCLAQDENRPQLLPLLVRGCVVVLVTPLLLIKLVLDDSSGYQPYWL
jgi:hypothetical protein